MQAPHRLVIWNLVSQCAWVKRMTMQCRTPTVLFGLWVLWIPKEACPYMAGQLDPFRESYHLHLFRLWLSLLLSLYLFPMTLISIQNLFCSQESATPWATRWDHYLHIFDPKIHWFSLIKLRHFFLCQKEGWRYLITMPFRTPTALLLLLLSFASWLEWS